MSAPSRPLLKSLPVPPFDPRAAAQAALGPAVGEPTGAARKGVRTAVGPDSQQGDGRYAVAWLRISAPGSAVPTATSKCLCGRDRSAVGHTKVLALIDDHSAHRDVCLLRTNQEGRQAA
ncbi:hypothetical protein PV728_15620 [Streptomyces europaeiscabiei]|uniref:hypothetical protein n=1 Tax=Streptomyces TaxID=1883 RepID=UPI00117F1D94|nr:MULTISPECIES: hypothetical protein [Streptomyces]MDX3631684.1 hypothetical protein [Streptomyces europaeiscabiei]MDX3649465.1 hypothetical protein [Streptomyces europaeiscabiei]WUD34459.1 hypothetical protein OG858_25675 [Streptomyces europaeiscabiei]